MIFGQLNVSVKCAFQFLGLPLVETSKSKNIFDIPLFVLQLFYDGLCQAGGGAVRKHAPGAAAG